MWLAAAAFLTTAFTAESVSAQRATKPLDIKPPVTRFQPIRPLPGGPEILGDTTMVSGYAQQLAGEKKVQARVIWIDATANLNRINDAEKINALVPRLKATGFNTIVLDVKPIVGYTLYPSQFAPKLTEWKGRTLPQEFDPLDAMVKACKTSGMSLMVSLNAFSEGHRDMKLGIGYDKFDWQTVLYEPRPYLAFATAKYPIGNSFNKLHQEAGYLSAFNEAAKVPTPQVGQFLVTVSRAGKVVDGFEVTTNTPMPTIPSGGSLVVGTGPGADFLRANAVPGADAQFRMEALFTPISERPEQQVPLMMNPNHPQVQSRAIEILKELVGKYEVDGVLYDDRLRYGGLNADFSPRTIALFQRYIGRGLQWPDDVFRFTLTPGLQKGVVPGPYYDAWFTWRAMTIRNFVLQARQAVTTTRPGTLFGIYAGSWFGEYPNFGTNWASPDADVGFWFNTPHYQQTGLAPLLDVLMTGCYYPTATVSEAMASGIGLGVTVEASGSFCNRLARDQCWVYAGIALDKFKNDMTGLEKAIQAAVATTQGIMVFDLSHDFDAAQPTFAKVFGAEPVAPPHKAPKLLEEARKRRANADKKGIKDRPIPVNNGAPGTGF